MPRYRPLYQINCGKRKTLYILGTAYSSNEIIKSEIKNIIDDYKLDESLSFSNYLKYSFRSHVYFNNEYYYFNYKEYEVEYYENNIVRVGWQK